MSINISLKNFIKSSFIILLCVSAVFTVKDNKIFAVDEPTKGVVSGITISPPSYELTANPGDVLNEVIKVTSNSDDVVTYETLVQDFRVEGQEGIVSLQGDDNPNSFSKWFQVTPPSFQLQPRETKNVQFSITIPQNAEPGGHFASLLFQPKAIESGNATGAQVLQQVGSLILLRVSGEISEKGSITKLESKTYDGSYETIVSEDGKTKYYSPRNEDLNKETPKSFFNEGPVAFDLVFKNEGNVHFRPKGTMTIYNLFGQKVDELQIEPKNVFPGGGERRLTVIWPNKNLWGIHYRATVTVLYGSKSETLTAQTSFWAFPLEAAAVILGVIVVLILLRKRLMRAVKVLAKGE